MNVNKTAKKRKRRVIVNALLLFIFVFLINYVAFALSVPPSHFLRFMSVGFIMCLLIVTALCIWIVHKWLKEIGREQHYESTKTQKLTIGGGLYECQSCGNRKVALLDKNCGVCGIMFGDGH